MEKVWSAYTRQRVKLEKEAVPEGKAICRQRELSPSGTKDALLEKIMERWAETKSAKPGTWKKREAAPSATMATKRKKEQTAQSPARPVSDAWKQFAELTASQRQYYEEESGDEESGAEDIVITWAPPTASWAEASATH